MSMNSPYAATPDQIANVMASIAGADPAFASANPALVPDAAASTDPSGTATTLSHASNITNAQDAVQTQQPNPGVLGWISDHLGHGPVGTALAWLGKPLQEISNDYKFIHAVYTQYGAGNGILATLGVAGGAAAGAFIGDPLAGAAAAAIAERQILGRGMWQNAYKLSQDPNYQVSFGRDLAHVVTAGADTSHGLGSLISGTADAAFDFAMDPLAIAGRAAAGLRVGKSIQTAPNLDAAGNIAGPALTYSKIPLAAHWSAFDRFLQSASLRVYSPDQIDAVYLGNPALSPATRVYHRALGDLAGSSPADVAVAHPELSKIADRIGAASTKEDVHTLIRDSIYSADNINVINGAAALPSRTLLGGGMSAARDAITNWGTNERSGQANWLIPKRGTDAAGNPKTLLPAAIAWRNAPGAAARTVTTWTGRKPYNITPGLEQVSATTFQLNDPGAYNSIYQMFRFGMGDKMAREHLDRYINAPDLASRRAIVNAGQLETLKAMGLPDDPQLLEDVRTAMTKASNGWSGGGPRRAYGFGHTMGDKVSEVENSAGTSPAALHPYQDDVTSTYLDFFAARRAIRDLHKATGVYGALDDGIRKNFIEGVFKPLALLTGGFALRVTAGETLQQMMRYGTFRTLRSIVTSAATTAHYKLDPGEAEALEGALPEVLSVGAAAKHIAAPTAQDIRAVHAYAENPEPINPLTAQEPASLTAANGYARSAMAGISNAALKLTRTADPARVDLATRMLIRGRGHIGSGAIHTGHGAGYFDTDGNGMANQIIWEKANRAAKLKGQDYHAGQVAWQPTHNYTVYDHETARFPVYWKANLDKASHDLQSQLVLSDVAQHLRDGMSPDAAWSLAVDKDAPRIVGRAYDPTAPGGMGAPLPPELDVYAAWRKDMARTVAQDPHLHAYNVADDLRNTVTGRDGTFHGQLLDNIVAGRHTPLKDLENLSPLTRPKAQIGPEMEGYTGGNLFKRFVQAGYNKVLDPIINQLSRNPLMLLATEREMRSLQWAVDSGTMDTERALSIAMQRATHAILPQIHNTANRSQLALAATNFVPFWFAQEQAYRRVGRLVAENPAALRYYMMIENGLSNPAFVKKDSAGNSYLALPFVGAWGQAAVNAMSALGMPLVSGLPIDATGNLESLKSVLPESNLPGVSPIVAVAANQLASFDPVLSKYLGKIVGEQNIGASIIDQLIPNSPARSFLKGVTLPEGDRGVQTAIANALAAAYYHGQMPGPDSTPQQQQQFADRIKNNARSALILKSILGLFSPIAPQVNVDDPGLRDEFTALVTKTGDYAKALDEFMHSHGDKAVSYTIARTEPTNAKIPYTNAALAWVNANASLLTGPNGVGAAFLVPQTGVTGDTQTISDELLKMGLRERRTPQQFMDAIYIAAGNNLIDPARRVHEQNLAKYANDPKNTQAENTAWSQYLQVQRLGNPLWYDNYTSDARRSQALTALGDLFAIRDQGSADMAAPQAQGVYALLGDFVTHSRLQAQLHQSSVAGAISGERKNWTDYLDSLAGYTDANGVDHVGTHPELATVIRSVFLPLAANNVDLSNLGAPA